MRLRYAILVSLLAHAGILVYSHVDYDPYVEELKTSFRFDSDERTVDLPQIASLAEKRPRSEQPLPDVDVSAGLDPRSEEEEKAEPEPKPSEKPESEPKPAPEPEPKEKPVSEPQPEPKKEGPEPVVAEKKGDAPVETTAAARASGAAHADGSGSVSSSGRATASDGATGSSSSQRQRGGSGIDRAKLKRGYARALYGVINRHRHYPDVARRAGIEGNVTLEVQIDEDGRILEVSVHDSSGHKILDRAAVDALRSIEELPSPPKALAEKSQTFHIPIRYKLNRRG